MSMILIAPAASISELQHQPYLRDSRAFVDTDTHSALDSIREQAPVVIAVERTFASSPAGHAFLKRIKTDPHLAGCDIQWVGIRRSPRYRLSETRTVVIDGAVARLLDISTTGAHVVSRGTLKPKQRVRLSLEEGASPVTAVVVWAHFELPTDGPCYRAGIEFLAGPSPPITEFIASLPGTSRDGVNGEGAPGGT